jgi:hypothetical protein
MGDSSIVAHSLDKQFVGMLLLVLAHQLLTTKTWCHSNLSSFWLCVCSRHVSNLIKKFGKLFNTLWTRKVLDLISYFPCLAL